MQLGSGTKDKPVELLVWGDSHAMAAMTVLDVLCKEHAIHGVAAVHSSQVPFIGYESRSEGSMMEESVAFNDAVAAYIRRKHVGDVILIGSWQGCIDFDHGTEKLRRALLATIAALKESGTRVWVMKDVPHQNFNVPNALASAGFFGRDPESLGLPATQERDALRAMAPLFDGIDDPDVTFLDPADLFFSPQGFYRVAAGGYALYRDNHHLSTHGAMLLRPLFEPIFEKIGQKHLSTTMPN